MPSPLTCHDIEHVNERGPVSRPSSVSATAGALLGMLAEGPKSGWDLVEEAKTRVGNFWTIQHSQVYRELAKLEADGHAEPLPVEGRGRRRYRITDQGREAYLDWVKRAPGDESVRIPFLLTVAFADDMPAEQFAERIAEQRRRHTERLNEYEAMWQELADERADGGGARLATLALGIGYERAALAWLEELPSFFGSDS
ncbi:PadR family transcriptional regulator [Gulosibacter molinativorax]|uniref:PadR family transcriptional regulator n=1 Tax=Gulosibacter molinativorax TaxID=256821 RepID=A0ABT7C9Q0_9MICO|nr:PadR family transcriptional regulator [Gulosibacter molinativorax]